MNDLTDAGFAALTAKISRDRGFGCASYKDKCLRRRIAVRMRARGVHTYADYAQVLDQDQAEYDRLLDALTINVTKLFRNWETYNAIAEKVVPALWAQPTATINVWSAGCSSGEEPYSLAALFHRHAAQVGAAAEADRRVKVLGSDIDARCLAAAAVGSFEEGDFADTPSDLRRRYFAPTPPFTVVPEVKRLVRFERRDLLAEAAPPGAHQLICCRNVMIYFDRETQERLFDKFHQALAPGGFLVLGKVETLLGTARTRFAVVDGRERIFRPL
ncbi:MAG: protein-glutamate O-methyltransferase CheR [Gemmatimonadaceae bacterium]|nr:protein-glutamate O-methyltransferase CheR [Gemmatimonadaceae bacterium]NUO96136.1 protein-glutamate O-methyltransferase CheR [Gemmatimonadaceae bacterium]NUP72584.1 protein-glutamate O-methyltransferase CheR [Gemmatimonadaceae bacterium]NUS34693.1 protein-glutamate O-methyltransferase CheR [Gemmatimonadaceae bacterium]NUS48802.1 protein-glutamate O-methyltransferase CheR [Gemmatimonadaceae bacterium]